MGEERLQQELAQTKAELQRLRGWMFRGMSTNKDLSVVSLGPILAGTETIITLE
jgi:hypothetical protein